MSHPEGGGWRCSYGTWHGIDEHCRCAGAVVTPTDLPDADRPMEIRRYAIDEHRTPCLRAVLNHPAETVVRRPRFANWEDGQIDDALVHGASVRGFISNGGESFVFSVPGGGYHEAGYGSFEDFVALVAVDRAAVSADDLRTVIANALQPDSDLAESGIPRKVAHAVRTHLGLDGAS